MFDPSSVAIVGASDTTGKWGNWLARNALKGAGRRPVFLINREGGEVLGQRAYRSLAEVNEPVELVVLAIGRDGFELAVDDALRAGAKVLVGITAGLGETGEAGRQVERRVVERMRATGAIMVGPNCLGVVDTGTELNLAFGEYEPGPVALVSQSGNLALELAQIARESELGFSRFVSVGNQADLDVTEVIEALQTHEPTRVIAAYVEDFHDGRAFARACRQSVRHGKHVVLLTVGSSRAGARAARSHTGALVSASAAVDAACHAAGILRATAPREVIDLAQAVLMPHPPRGRRVGVVGDGGGHVALAADLATENGLELPLLSAELSTRIAATLPPSATTTNPIDLAGGGEQDFSNYARTVQLLHDSGEVDAVLLTGYFGGYSEDAAPLARSESEVAAVLAAAKGPMVVHSMYPRSSTLIPLRVARVPVYGDIRSAARALGRLARREDQSHGDVPELPTPKPPSAAPEDYFAARRLVEKAGIEVVEAREVRTLVEARTAARELGYPVALKALGESHKSDAGGVRLGLADEGALNAAFMEIDRRLSPPTWSVERMAETVNGVEMIVGVHRDHSFGPVVVVGVGGVFAELVQDVAVALAPVSAKLGERLIRSLKAAPMLLGVRGRPPLDVPGAARAIEALSRLAAEHAEIGSVEVNPLLVLTDRVVALDAHVVMD